MTYVKERIPNGFRTVNSAEFCANNAYNGFDFASQAQPPVERVADQALAREKTLPKSTPDTTPTAIMAGPGSIIRCARKRPRFRARERRQSGGRGNAERNCLSPAPLRGRWVIDPGPAMILTVNPDSGRAVRKKIEPPSTPSCSARRSRAQRAVLVLRAAQAFSQWAERLGDLGALGGSIFFLTASPKHIDLRD